MATVRPKFDSRNLLAGVIDPPSPLEALMAAASLFLACGHRREGRRALGVTVSAQHLAAHLGISILRLSFLMRASRKNEACRREATSVFLERRTA